MESGEGRCESPTIVQLRKRKQWDETRRVYKPLFTLDKLPEEVVELIAQHMEYSALLKWAITCHTLHRHAFNTWRGQALLLRTKTFGTPPNFRAVFARHVVWKTEKNIGFRPNVVEVGVNIVYSYSMIRRHENRIAFADQLEDMIPQKDQADRLVRVRCILHNAVDVYNRMLPYYTNKTDRLLSILSSIHMPLTAEYLKAQTGRSFKEVVSRMVNGYRIQWGCHNAQFYNTPTLFVDGRSHPNDPDHRIQQEEE